VRTEEIVAEALKTSARAEEIGNRRSKAVSLDFEERSARAGEMAQEARKTIREVQRDLRTLIEQSDRQLAASLAARKNAPAA